MWEAVVPARRPEKVMCIFMVLATMSIMTPDNPVPGDGVPSLAPLRVAVNVIVPALSGIE